MTFRCCHNATIGDQDWAASASRDIGTRLGVASVKLWPSDLAVEEVDVAGRGGID